MLLIAQVKAAIGADVMHSDVKYVSEKAVLLFN